MTAPSRPGDGRPFQWVGQRQRPPPALVPAPVPGLASICASAGGDGTGYPVTADPSPAEPARASTDGGTPREPAKPAW